jgi:hypothetical protein
MSTTPLISLLPPTLLLPNENIDKAHIAINTSSPASKVGGGWQENVNDHRTMTVGEDK